MYFGGARGPSEQTHGGGTLNPKTLKPKSLCVLNTLMGGKSAPLEPRPHKARFSGLVLRL